MLSKPVSEPFCIQFGDDFELDVRAFQLRSVGIPVKLKPMVMELLLFLVERRGELVTREEIVERIWGKGVFLDTDNSINGAISKIRQVLRDDAERPRFVETVKRKGYRFISPVVEIRSSADVAVAESGSATPETLIGKRVSHYRILQLLGGGGMAVVYKAEDLKLGRPVAMKFLPSDLASDPVAFERLQREARAASALDHRNICSVYQLGEHEGQPFIVMQYLEGQTLREWIETKSSVSARERVGQLLDLAIQIADGLDAAHQKGIVHRDIKPANIIVTNRGEAKILDFGVAKFVDAVESARARNDAVPLVSEAEPRAACDLTQTGMSVGTPSYLSPEQIRREKLDPRSDLFSFGLILYEIATGQRAFAGDTVSEIRDAVLSQPVVPVRQLAPEVPLEFERIIDQCLEKDRDLRYQSAQQVRQDLQKIQPAADMATSSPPKPSLLSPMPRWGARSVAIFASIAIIAGLIWGVFRYRTVQAAKINEKDTIVLADFANSTGDAVFDGTLKQGLSIALSQSPFLNIVSDRRTRSTLGLMTQPADATLTSDLAREVCQRTQSKAFVAGAVAALGTEYVIGLKAENCQDGEILAEEQVTAKNKEGVIPALGIAASRLRRALGESIASVQKQDVPLREATTGSLEALKEYTLGGQAENEQGQLAAIAHYQKAVALDPLFARAYSSLSTEYFDAGESALAAKYATKAYELRKRGTELEQVQIEAVYHSFTTGDLEKAAAAYERWKEIRPRSPSPDANLGYIYAQLGQNEKALDEALIALRMGPSGEHYTNVISSYLALGRLHEAKATAAAAESQKMNLPLNHNNLYLIGFLEHDRRAMDQEADWAMGKPQVEALLLYSEFCTSAYYGQMKAARDLLQRASASAITQDSKETAAGFRADGALHEALYGNLREAHSSLAAVPVSSSGQDVQATAALAYAFADDRKRAQTLADDLAKRYPENTIVQLNYLPAIRARIALSSRNAGQALQLLQVARPVELGQPAQAIALNLYPVYIRGEAYLAAHDGAAARGEFQRTLDTPGMSLNEPIAALAYLGIARANVELGDTNKARSAYEDFLTLWKNADADVPILRQAKSEYAKLEPSR